jgi:predicted DsbA family dithiol-disulfide isomerase
MEIILNIGESVGLNNEELQKRLVEGYYDEVLDRVAEEAHNNRINSTPTFIIDERYAVVGAQPIENFRNALLKIEKQL